MEPPPGSSTRWKQAAAVAALVALAVALERRARLPAEPLVTAGFPRPTVALPLPERRAPPPQAAPVSEFDKLLALFREAEADSATAPAVRAFAEEFQETPELEKAYADFAADQKGPDPKETVASFVQSLSDKAEFRQLVSRFAQDPGFRGVAQQLSARPEIRDAIQAVLQKARSEKALKSALASSGRGAGRLSAAREASRAGAGVARRTDAGAGPSSTAASGGASQTALASIPDAKPGGSADRKRVEGRSRQGGAAHDVDPVLSSIGNASGKPASKFCANFPQFKPFCTGVPPHLKPEFEPIEAQIMRYGLWGACFVTDKYESCRAVCRGACDAPEAWDACLEAYDDNELACLKECQERAAWCSPDEQVVETRCVKRLPTACSAAQRQALLAALPSECGPLRNVYCANTPAAAAPGDDGKPGRAWLGYDVDPKTGKYSIDPEEQWKIQRLYKMRHLGLDGNGPMAIDEIWDWVRKNMPIERGDMKFAENKIGQLLKRRRMYCGRMPGLPKVLQGEVAKQACGGK